MTQHTHNLENQVNKYKILINEFKQQIKTVIYNKTTPDKLPKIPNYPIKFFITSKSDKIVPSINFKL